MIQTFTFSESGASHINEDAVSLKPHPSDSRIWLCALADGQGGRSGGFAAANLAVSHSITSARALSANQLADCSAWERVARQADIAVQNDPQAGLTTLVCLSISTDQVCGVSSGDSAALLLMNGKSMILTEKQAKNPPVGSGAAIFRCFSSPLVVPWKLMVMSDGVWKYLGWERLIALSQQSNRNDLISNLTDTVRSLHQGHFPDDFTVAVLQKLTA